MKILLSAVRRDNGSVEYFTKKEERSPYVKARFMLAVFDGIGVHYLADPQSFPIDEIREVILEQL
jgi:hypothetical protein